MSEAGPSFHEEQTFRQRHARLALATPPAAIVFIALRQLAWHRPWETPPISSGDLLYLSVLLVAVYIRLVTVRLVTDLWATEISVGLSGLWQKRKISLDQVHAAKVVEYDAARDFGGYGFRSGAGGRAYIAGGNRGVELELRDGRKVLIGSQRPADLAKQIAACLSGVVGDYRPGPAAPGASRRTSRPSSKPLAERP